MTLPLLALPTRNVGPIPFRVVPFADAVRAVLESSAGLAGQESGVAVHFANAYTVALADSDPRFAQLLARPGSVAFTDGVPVAWVGRRAYPELAGTWDRVYGPDVMQAALEASTADGPKHYLLGSSPGTLASLRDQIALRWPEAAVVGAESPPFRPLSVAEVRAQDARIRDSGATIVWVGLGTPKQDAEVARLAGELPVVAMAVGAAFDFLAGVKPQAPLWMQRSGTEWAFRLASEPRRLARRYLWGNPRFLLAAARTPGLRRRAERA
jgi:N-acetylglucosaminyldiphosphoundecaprenol N-acetyl-beta-D-mannosaminyltransferase